MAYDKHYPGGAAGDISPLARLDQIATYAEATIPVQKIVFGLPWYGYDWLGTNATSLTFADAESPAQRVGATITHDADGEATFTYSGHSASIAGFAHWRAGAEDPAIWDEVATLKTGSNSPATPAPQDFAISGPAAMVVNRGGGAERDVHRDADQVAGVRP